MSKIKAKSEFNLLAAKVLIDEHDYYAPSVHCSYYGCFQFIKYKLNQLGQTYDIVSQTIEADKTLHSHTYPINLLLQELSAKGVNRHDVREVKEKINDLKYFRVVADYHDKEISFQDSNKALTLSNEIISIINKKL